MAQKQEHRIGLHDRVRIKDTVTHMYPYARVWSEGVVLKRMHDNMGYPLIWIQWDKDHWAYSGEEDRWVLEAHFDKVENNMAEEDKPDFLEAIADLVERYRRDGMPDSALEEDASKVDPRPTGPLTYKDILDKGAEAAAEGEAFVLLVATPETYQGTELVIPRVYMHSKNDASALLLDAAMADYVSQAMARLVQKAQDDGTPSS